MHELREEADRIRSRIGVWLRREPHHTEATRSTIMRWSRAIGERNRLWLDEGHARRTTLGSIVAPPCWLYSVDDTVVAPGLPGFHTIYGRVTWEFVRWLHLGEPVRSRARLVDMQEKSGRFAGQMIAQIGETLYTGGRGDTVARAKSTVLRTSREAARERGKYLGRTKHVYEPAELLAIEDGYDREEIRGVLPRYWEDVVEREEVRPIVRGPLTAEDMLQFVCSTRPIKAFSAFHAHRGRHPGIAFRDHDTGIWETWEASMLLDEVARGFGFPLAHDAGIDRISWLGSLLTNWMGDDGFLRRLDVTLLAPNFYGDATWCKGVVARKHRTREVAVVEVDLWCENQIGERTAEGTAHIELPSRSVD